MLEREAKGRQPRVHEETLANLFDGVIQQVEAEIEGYLKSLPEQPPLEEFRQACRVLLRASRTLVQGEAGPMIGRKDLLSHFDARFLGLLFQFDLAYDIIVELPKAAARARQLLECAAEVEPGRAAQEYLSRVARCFTWGYEAETLILSRSVIEQIVKDAVPCVDVFDVFSWKDDAFRPDRQEKLRKRDPFLVTFGDRIQAGVVLKKLTPDEAKLAMEIWDKGSDAVHSSPDPTVDLMTIVKGLTRLIGKLCRDT